MLILAYSYALVSEEKESHVLLWLQNFCDVKDVY